MGQPEAVIVSKFKGIHRPGLTTRITTRRILDEPREMYNFHITDDGHLYMPECSEEVYDFSADGVIKTLHYTETPRGIVVQMSNGKIYFIGLAVSPTPGTYDPDPIVPTLLATIAAGEEQWNIWINGTRAGYFLMGYCPRGSAGPVDDGKTWKVSGSPGAYVVDDITATVGRASWSTLYKGRRFWVSRGRSVNFSPLNQLDAAPESNFGISGDDAGNTYWDNPGFVQGMIAWEDVLVFFLTGSVWMLTGSDPDTFNLRQVQTMVGNASAWALVRTDEGVLTVGGTNLNNPGLFLFTGSNAVKFSDKIDDWFLSLGKLTATISAGRYILGTSRSGESNRQFLILDLRTKEWVAFDGYEQGTSCVRGQTIYVNNGGVLYAENREIFPRAPGRPARIRIGYQDDENPSGLVRYLGLKIAGRYWGTGTPTVTVTASTPDGQVVSGPHDIATDVFDNLVIPLNIRGAGIELYMEFTPADDDNELLIENLQLITSRKGEKVSRG